MGRVSRVHRAFRAESRWGHLRPGVSVTAVVGLRGRPEDLATVPGPAALECLAPASVLVALLDRTAALDRAASLEDLATAPFPVTLLGLTTGLEDLEPTPAPVARSDRTTAASLEDLALIPAMPARLVLTAPVVPAASVAPN
jgi:hypothetical protein